MSTVNKRPELNVWDCTELMPGARPDTLGKNHRPTPAEREDFESRAKFVHECDKAEPQEETFSRAMQAQQELDMLTEMFPTIDKQLIQNIYADTGMNLEKCVELFMSIASDVDPLTASAVAASHPEPPVVIDNGKDWPVLTTIEGWQIAGEVTLEGRDISEETGCTWKDALSKKSGPFESIHPRGKPSVKQLTGYKPNPKKGNSREEKLHDGDPNVADYEGYKKLTHKRLHRFAKSAATQGGDDEAAAGGEDVP